MQVRVLNDDLEVLWVKTETGGLTGTSFRRDGTLEKIIAALESALEHARAESDCQETGGDVALENSAALASMLDRQFLVDISHYPIPNTRGLEERVPCGGRSEVGAVAGLPNHHNVAG